MGKNKIKTALFGLGRIGQMHADNLRKNSEFDLKYVFDLNKNLLNKISKRFNAISINNPDIACLLYTSPSPRDIGPSRMPSSA